MSTRSLGHRAPLLWLVLPFIAGLTGGRVIEFESVAGLLGTAALGAALAIWAAYRAPPLWAGSLGLAMLFAGAASYTLHRLRLPVWHELPAREARLTLRVDRVFPSMDAKRASGLATVIATAEHLRELQEQRVYFSLTLRRGDGEPIRSEQINVVGVIASLPRAPPANSFDGYLTNAGVNFRFSRARIVGIERSAHGYYRFCARSLERLKKILREGIFAKRPELAAAFGAMLLGQQHELSDAQEQLFLQTGTMHIFSISGLHIAAIAAGLYAVLSLLRLPRAMRLVVELGLLWLYVDITGGVPSAVRAFVMVALVQGSMVLRVPANPLAALATSAWVVLLAAPMQLFSASFQMSYGIVIALIVMGLPLAEAWQARWSPFRDLPQATWRRWQHVVASAWQWGATAVAIGVATSLVSAITGVMFFELVTPGALLVNLMLIPMSSLVIYAGFASLLGGLAGIGWWTELFNHAGAFGLWVIEWALRAFVRLPGMWREARFVTPWLGATTLGLVLVSLFFGYAHRWENHRGGYWLPFAFTVAVFIFGVEFGKP